MFRSKISLITRRAQRSAIAWPALLIAILAWPTAVTAQDQTSDRAAPSSPTVERRDNPPPPSQADDRYRIGAGDVLDIRVFNRPQLSREAVRVDGRGLIRMPLVEDEIAAACLTEGELAREIAAKYRRYLRNPQVDVFVKEFQSQPVALIGAVEKPGRFQLQRRVRLLELLTFAGGPIDRAGGRIHLIHAEDGGVRCGGDALKDHFADEERDVMAVFNLVDTLRGESKSNPYVQPGDVVSIPEAEQAFVVGNVLRPLTIALKEKITVTRAIAMAGGTLPDTKSEKVRILRQAPGGTTRTEIFIDLKAIDKLQAEDVALQSGDVVDVPTSGGKRFLRSLVGAVAPAVSQLPVSVVR